MMNTMDTMNTWTVGLQNSFTILWSEVIKHLPALVVALLIVIIGWAVGSLVGRFVSQVVKSARVDEFIRKTGVEDTLRKGGMHLNSGNFLGGLVKWFIITVFLVAAFDILGLTVVNQFLSGVVLEYLPRVIIAVLVLLLAGVIGDVMQKIVVTSARSAELRSAYLLGTVTRWAIWIFALLVALSHLGIAAQFVSTIFTGVIVALSLALGLSFGLGGQDAASRFIEKTRQEITHKD